MGGTAQPRRWGNTTGCQPRADRGRGRATAVRACVWTTVMCEASWSLVPKNPFKGARGSESILNGPGNKPSLGLDGTRRKWETRAPLSLPVPFSGNLWGTRSCSLSCCSWGVWGFEKQPPRAREPADADGVWSHAALEIRAHGELRAQRVCPAHLAIPPPRWTRGEMIEEK